MKLYKAVVDDQLTNPELFQINPNRAIPAIEDNGFTLFERYLLKSLTHLITHCPLFSTAIMKYIYNKFNLPEHWYPKDLHKQAHVDEALGWFPQNLRCGAYYVTVCGVLNI